MKKLLTRGLMGLAALTVPVGAALALPMAAHAAPLTSTTSCTTDIQGATVNGNLDVPAGATCSMWGEVKGNVTVEGSLMAWGGHFDKNVSVVGGSFSGNNYGVQIDGNLSYLNPAVYGYNGFWGNQYGTTNVVKGNMSYTIDSSTAYPMYQSPLLYFGGGTTVQGNFTYSDQGAGFHGHLDTGGLSVKGHQTISQNAAIQS